MKATVIGASGYSGGELLRLIATHPHFQLHAAIAHTSAGEKIAAVHSHLASSHRGSFDSFTAELIDSSDLLFFALPHGESGKIISDHKELFASKKIIDLGADFRLTSTSQWEKYYGGKHHGVWHYGLPELPGQREKILTSTHIANPGCYATALTLALAPFTQVVEKANLSDVVITAASGTTGAGRSAKINLLGSEVMNSLSAYKVGGVHQHTPEIEQALTALSGSEVRLSFTPFLAPMPRGILASVSVPVTGISLAEIRDLFSALYLKESFIHILQEGFWPQTNSLIGSNGIQLQVALDEHIGRAIVIAAIDNLGKGAAGQALQNANLVTGIDEGTGLSPVGVR